MIEQIKAHPEWKILFEEFKESDYGTVIPHEDIEALTGFTRKKTPQKYYGCVSRWKNSMLKEASRQIECVTIVGYEIVKPEKFRTSASRQLKFGNKRIKKAGEIIIQTPLLLLDEDEKKRIGETGVIISQILHFSKATMKKVREIDKKTDKLLLDVGKALDVAD